MPHAAADRRRGPLRAAGATGTVVLAGDRAVRRLNARHRGRNKPTNVLTYDGPRAGDDPGAGRGAPRGRRARRAARRTIWRTWWCTARCTCAATTTTTAGEARRMEMAEARILHRLGVPNPWKRA